MSFADDLHRFSAKVERQRRDVFVGVVTAVQDSVVEGSPITAAPGQPVDTGHLKASWQVEFESDTRARVTTNVDYAPAIEEGMGRHGPMTLRSQVGGFHSVALTRAGFQALVDSVVRDVTGVL